MKRLMIAFGIVMLTSSSGQAAIYNSATGHWYDIVDPGANGSWTNAESKAVALGGHLVTINDAAEEAWLRTTFGSGTRYWIGFTDEAVEGTWVWASGEPVTYTHWNQGEPNDWGNGEDYALMNWDTGTGAWNDWDYLTDYDHPIDGIAESIREPSVPEPATIIVWSLLAALGITIGWWRRRKAA
jgi:hypothetical protein